jgi:hypothetical protein
MKFQCDEQAFLDLPEDTQALYKAKHMSTETFNILRRSIKGIQNNKFTDIDNFNFVPYCRCTMNQRSFEPVLYNVQRDTIEHPTNMTLECAHCAHLFVANDFTPFRKKERILCKGCEQEFSPTKPKFEVNISHEKVTHKTAFQHKFIKFCNKNNIIITNGPKNIPFNHTDGSGRNANIHFHLPECNRYVDIAGNLECHKVQSPRMKAMELFSESSGCKYIELHPKTYVKVTRAWKKHVDRLHAFNSSVQEPEPKLTSDSIPLTNT